jgi:transcriptional regulator with XRE-family HTH domain
MNLRTQVAQLIKKLRKESGLTQVQLASLAKMDQSNRLSDLERAKHEPSFSEIERLAEALSIEITITITKKGW